VAGARNTRGYGRGAREASEFYVNGLEPVVTVRTRRATACKVRPSTVSKSSIRLPMGVEALGRHRDR